MEKFRMPSDPHLSMTAAVSRPVAVRGMGILLASLLMGATAAAAPTDPPPAPPADVAAPPAGIRKAASGLAMKVLERGQGHDHPVDNDCVTVDYVVWKRDGALLSSSRRWPDAGRLCLRTMIPGMAQAVKQMVVGEQRRIWVPAALTSTGDGEDARRGVDETAEITLLEIRKAPPVPTDLKAPPLAATKLPSGLAMRVLKKGSGTQHPSQRDSVKLNFSGWTKDGALIESSVMAHHPAVFEMTAMMPGWREALGRMVAGEQARLWIPAALAYGDKPRRGQPKGDLVYDLELLSIEPAPGPAPAR
jgi:FKBP-type peptidyl-prolyl cis-trans isomerase